MEDYFIKIKEPKKIKREILEASKDMLTLLFDYEQIKEIRNERLEALNNSKGLTKEMRLLIDNIKKQLPKVGAVPLTSQGRAKNLKTGEIPEKTDDSELKALEKELIDIEKKIKKI